MEHNCRGTKKDMIGSFKGILLSLMNMCKQWLQRREAYFFNVYIL